MSFLMPVRRRFPNDTLKTDLEKEDAFLTEHGGWGPRLTFLFFEAVFDLHNQIHGLFEKRRR